MGTGKYAWNNRDEVKNYYTVNIGYSQGYAPDTSAFTNVREFAPYEDFPGRVTVLDYVTCAKYFSMSQSSLADPEPFFEHCDADTRFDHPLTRREAITAAGKLKLAYEVMHSGSFGIPATNWEDPLLADARHAREAILNSPTAITKGEDLILGETYTGNAYYVSNSGDDGNDGLSPETPWASLKEGGKGKAEIRGCGVL